MTEVFTRDQKIMLAVWLNNFQLRDKLSLIQALKSEDSHVPFELAVQEFVDKFEETYSVDAPYPKRIGRWVGLHAPEAVIERLLHWAAEAGAADSAPRYRKEFHAALDVARRIDRSTRPPLAA